MTMTDQFNEEFVEQKILAEARRHRVVYMVVGHWVQKLHQVVSPERWEETLRGIAEKIVATKSPRWSRRVDRVCHALRTYEKYPLSEERLAELMAKYSANAPLPVTELSLTMSIPPLLIGRDLEERLAREFDAKWEKFQKAGEQQ
jgi:hypothetical protein